MYDQTERHAVLSSRNSRQARFIVVQIVKLQVGKNYTVEQVHSELEIQNIRTLQ